MIYFSDSHYSNEIVLKGALLQTFFVVKCEQLLQETNVFRFLQAVHKKLEIYKLSNDKFIERKGAG